MRIPVLITSVILLIIAVFPARIVIDGPRWWIFTAPGRIAWEVMWIEVFIAVAIGGISWGLLKRKS